MDYEYHQNLTQPSLYEENAAVITKSNLPLPQAIKIAAEIFAQYDDGREDLEAQTQDITSFIRGLLSQDIIPGDADDWHNLAVDIARRDYFDLACDVLDGGLRFFPNNTDLLGDYLQYGTSCHRIQQCQMCYARLSNMPKVKYTWRSFHFSANWLTYLWEQSLDQEELDRLLADLLNLAAQYRRYFPNSEESFLCEANIYKLIKDTKKEVKSLTVPINKAIPAPKCALRLADHFFESGDYGNALEMVQRSLKDSNQVQQVVNEAYLHYLSGLSKISLLQAPGEMCDPKDVVDIYMDFESSLRLDIRSNLRDGMCQKVGMLRHQYGVAIPPHCSRLFEIMDDRDMVD